MARQFIGAAVFAVAVTTVAPAHAQVRQFDIAPGPLDGALDQYARQSGRQVIYKSDEVGSAKSRGARGALSVDAALQSILLDTGFVTRADVSGAVAIVRAPKTRPVRAKQAHTPSTGPAPTAADADAREMAPAEPSEIVVTGTKRARGESVQEAAVTISAFGSEQLEQAKIRDLYALGNLVPNVILTGSGTYPGTATFSIRGMAVNNSIPSSTPTVGVFVDGIFAGVGSGLALDNFDIEGVEVLRGPQGLLFGRNVTAGAVLQRTTEPSSTLKIRAQAGVESGPKFTESLVVSGPLTSTLAGKVAVYRSDDSGWFRNRFDNSKFGESSSTRINAALAFTPADDLRVTGRYSFSKTEGDGPAVQNHGEWSRDSFDFAINTPGFFEIEWHQASLDIEKDVAFGNGKIVNIAGYRTVTQRSLTDFDGTTQPIFNVGALVDQHQFSNELRYSGDLGPVAVTVGGYYYTDRLLYIENRILQSGANNLVGGGRQASSTIAFFGAFDVSLTDTFQLNLGARYSREKKHARVNRISPAAISGCSIILSDCTTYGFDDSDRWSAFNPKIGLTWKPDNDTNLYGFWTRGNRSGGYNLRQASAQVPGPYDQETEDSFEVGLKKRFFDRRLTVNLAGFVNKYKKLQRDISRTDPVLGSVQLTANTADATIRGLEAEITAQPVDGLTLSANLGYLDPEFSDILFDLSGNGSVGPEDYRLRLPLLSKWSYGAAATYKHAFGNGHEASARISFTHRDMAFSTDDNRGFLNAVDYLDAGLTYAFRGGWAVSLYGKNLTNQVFYGLDVPLPFVPGETHSPLSKGRVLGVELSYRL
ncbi:TonB-dependent receptor [Sphingomonas flavalba]|uniref:TonB-dependent receptor n=1 Tax=Sphingomonas flavalba TaxID=2559804 RepID=UPI001EF0B5C1|nr:TonB-dependent receptor [Sphingomonas flavalba]